MSKTRARGQDTRRREEAAADRLDRSADHEDRKLAGDVRTFLQERANIETVPDRMLRDAEARVIAARQPARTDPSLEPGVPRGTPQPPARRRGQCAINSQEYRKSTRLNSSHACAARMPSPA